MKSKLLIKNLIVLNFTVLQIYGAVAELVAIIFHQHAKNISFPSSKRVISSFDQIALAPRNNILWCPSAVIAKQNTRSIK
jgi:hypothetical protein